MVLGAHHHADAVALCEDAGPQAGRHDHPPITADHRKRHVPGRVRPMPIAVPCAKNGIARLALRWRPTSGKPEIFSSARFSAPPRVPRIGLWLRRIFNAPMPWKSYAQGVEQEGALDRLEAFPLREFGPAFYGLGRPTRARWNGVRRWPPRCAQAATTSNNGEGGLRNGWCLFRPARPAWAVVVCLSPPPRAGGSPTTGPPGHH